MIKRPLATLFAAAALAVASTTALAAGPRVLFLSKSAGFQHSVITRIDGQPSYADPIVAKVVEGIGGTLESTKDASKINAEYLKNLDVVIFYTTGILTEPGTDGEPPMGPNGMAELQDWVKAGGGFLAFHCGSDTFHGEGEIITPYIDMVCGEFAGHGPQFFGDFIVVDEAHPAMKPFGSQWRVKEEWYTFKNFNKANMHVLALLDASKAAEKMHGKGLPAYGAGPYPVAWTRAFGSGRVYYNALGHREEVWDTDEFQQSMGAAILWADGQGDLNAEPNYDKVVPAPKPAPVEEPAPAETK